MPQAGELTTMVLLGVAGSVHCLGMCSGLVGCLGQRLRAQLLYQVGRLLTYAAGGALLAGVGASARASFQAATGPTLLLAAGGLMLLMGARLLIGEASTSSPWVRWLQVRLRAPMRHLLVAGGPLAALGLGAVTGLLPCGLLYVALLRAAASARPVEGAWLMGAFWLGTAPALAAVAALLPRLRASHSGLWRRLPAAAVLVLGLLTLWRAQDLHARTSGQVHAGVTCCEHCGGAR
jgi:uncharacterized protein